MSARYSGVSEKGRMSVKKLESQRGSSPPALSVQTRERVPYGIIPSGGEMGLYRALREAVPIIDASIIKLRRLIGGFRIECRDKATERELDYFLKHVRVGHFHMGIDQFIGAYLEQLLTYGSAVGEIILQGQNFEALWNAELEGLELREKSPLQMGFFVNRNGRSEECPYPELILFSALNPEPGQVYGVSVLRGLPFVSEILLKIYRTIGTNWERIGNVRFAVSCKQDGSSYGPERAKQVAAEWQKAMRSAQVSDFISIGDVSVKAVGADVQILDSQVPVRQMLEQIVAKMGIPPFLLGLSWSSTERMSSQQADILTSELEAYRRTLDPVIAKIVELWMRLNGRQSDYTIEWEDITMQDEVDHATARKIDAERVLLEEQSAAAAEGRQA